MFFETYEDLEHTFNEAVEQQQDRTKVIAIHKKAKKIDNFGEIQLPLLYPNGRIISTEKKKDLLDLLEFVPLEHHSFYINLNHGTPARIDESQLFIMISDDDDN